MKRMTDRTGFVYDEYMTRHKNLWDPYFPEKPERLTDPYQRCCELGLISRCFEIKPQICSDDLILLGHHEALVDKLKSTVSMNEKDLKAISQKYDSVYFHNETYECCRRALGSTIALMENIVDNKVRNGLALVRPPGHHAMTNEFCGFCFFNNVGIAAKHAVNELGLERVLIVDWDVHHGQATQYMFYEDPRVLYFSIHRYEHGQFWPNLRESDYDWIGEGEGNGYNINVPLNQKGMTDSDYMAIFHQILMPVAYEFSPDLILISAGFDSALGDLKGEMKVSPVAFAHFTHMLSGLAEGRVCAVLEGGYCLKSLSESVALTLRSLLGDACPQMPEMIEPCDSICESVLNVIKVLKPYWNCFCYQETCSDGELCPFSLVNEMPPRPGIEFSTAENHPDMYELEYNYPGHGQEETPEYCTLSHMYDDQIEALIQGTSLITAPYRTCFTCESQSCIKQMEEKSPKIFEKCFILQAGESEHQQSTQSVLTTVQKILAGQSQNGIVVTRNPVTASHLMTSVSAGCEKYSINRVMIVEMNASKKNICFQFPDGSRVLYIPFIISGPCGDMETSSDKWTIPIVWKEIPTDSDLFTAFHQIVLPIAYQFGPKLILLNISEQGLKECSISDRGLQHIIHMLSSLAGGRLAIIAEERTVSPDVILACTSTLLGYRLPVSHESKSMSHSAIETISQVLDNQKQNWSCLKFRVKIPG